ncbi:hypothetical protein [Arthrobacter sp. B1805]|nr:hypothetical protein [Arthrobacter sp. B1805]
MPVSTVGVISGLPSADLDSRRWLDPTPSAPVAQVSFLVSTVKGW